MSPTFEAAVEALADLSVPAPVLPYLTTLRRLPDEVVLDMATRELDLGNSNWCLCGWAMRDILGAAADEREPVSAWGGETALSHGGLPSTAICDKLSEAHGGTHEEWAAIYWGATDDRAESIELAFLLRVEEAASR